MGRAPCCDKATVKKGPWSPEEDTKLKSYIEQNGTGGNWIALPQKIGLKRCGKSCRLRWLNYLRPNIRHGGFSEEEDRIILSLYISIGSRWSIIAAQLPGRTDNDIKNYWNTRLKKKLFGKQSRKDQRQQQQHFMRQAAASDGMKQEANGGASGSSSMAEAAYSWHQQATTVPMQQPTPGIAMDGHRPGDGVDESIRKLLHKLKLGGSPFASLPQFVPPPLYEGSPSFAPTPCQVEITSLYEAGVQCSNGLPSLEQDQNLNFNQVKLDGLDFFFGMGDQSIRWSEVNPLACTNNTVASSSQGMQQYGLADEPANLGIK